MADNKSSVGKLKIDLDCADAIKGLKAVQREAKKATAALKEFEEQQKKLTRVSVFNGEAKCPKCGSNKIILEELLSYGLGVVERRIDCEECGWES